MELGPAPDAQPRGGHLPHPSVWPGPHLCGLKSLPGLNVALKRTPPQGAPWTEPGYKEASLLLSPALLLPQTQTPICSPALLQGLEVNELA